MGRVPLYLTVFGASIWRHGAVLLPWKAVSVELPPNVQQPGPQVQPLPAGVVALRKGKVMVRYGRHSRTGCCDQQKQQNGRQSSSEHSDQSRDGRTCHC